MLSAFLARHFSNKHYDTNFAMRLMLWTVAASAVFAGGWYWLSMRFGPQGGAAAFGTRTTLGLMLLLTMMVLLGSKGVHSGRGAEMWAYATGLVRRKLALR
jgi:biotin transporter BioY